MIALLEGPDPSEWAEARSHEEHDDARRDWSPGPWIVWPANSVAMSRWPPGDHFVPGPNSFVRLRGHRGFVLQSASDRTNTASLQERRTRINHLSSRAGRAPSSSV